MSSLSLRQDRSASARPLYQQVRELLLERVRRGEWRPGRSLPNEFVLASEYKVSIGTVRRAVGALEEAGILVRKQGRGTFLATPDSDQLDDRFCRLRAPGGTPQRLRYTLASVGRRIGGRHECRRLGLADGAELIEVAHIVDLRGRPVGLEIACADAGLVSIGDEHCDGHPYARYARQGLIVTRVADTLAATTVDGDIAARLGVGPGTPVLKLERVAHALDERPLEWRIAYYLAAETTYVAHIGAADCR